MEVDELRVRVENCESGAPVAVAGCPTEPGLIKYRAPGFSCRATDSACPTVWYSGRRPSARVTDKKSALQMRMSKEVKGVLRVIRGASASPAKQHTRPHLGRTVNQLHLGKVGRETGPRGRARSHSRFSGVNWLRVQMAQKRP